MIDRTDLWTAIVLWSASLLGPDTRARAEAVLPAEAHGPPPADLPGRLRAATTVRACDAVLDAVARPDWTALAEEHRRRPFARTQRRALVARAPGAFARELLTPWDSLVAARLGTPPPWARRRALEAIGEVRPSLIRRMLTEETAEELIRTTPRLDLLVRAVDGYDHNHHVEARAFWECAGRLLRDERTAWPAAAAALPSHRGPFRSLRPRQTRPEDADLRVLAQAPDAVLAGVVETLTDEALAAMRDRDLGRLRARESLTGMVLDRFAAAGVPARAIFSRWAYGAHCAARTRAWAHGRYPYLDQVNEGRAAYDVTLRLLLARSAGRSRPATNLPAELRACDGPIEAEALLTATYGPDGSPPWHQLIFDDSPLPVPVLCVLAARAGFPARLARQLPVRMRTLLAGQSPAVARLAVTDLDRMSALRGIRANHVLDDAEITATSRPARALLRHLYAAGDGAAAYARLLESLAPDDDFWPELRRLLPTFAGTVPELLTEAARRPG